MLFVLGLGAAGSVGALEKENRGFRVDLPSNCGASDLIGDLAIRSNIKQSSQNFVGVNVKIHYAKIFHQSFSLHCNPNCFSPTVGMSF